ncbi:MAG: cell division protein ZapA [Haliscomenobacter sp.]|nr:cell division protein ZapA [Haliscomenobacter sp.]
MEGNAMEGQENKHITVVIGGRPYPFKIKAEDEAAIRKIVKEVNEKINLFQLTYTNKDKQDCLSMVLLTYAVDLFKSRQSAAEDAVASAKLSHFNQLLDEMLAQK